MKFTTLASFLSFSLAAIAANHDVDVGEDGLVFNPSSISCSGSDTVTFHFYPGGHSVVSSAFNKPCEADGVISSGSGFNPTKGEDKNVFVIDCPKSATYLFCSQFGHCKGGMVAAINAPTSGQTLNAYKSAAGKAADDGGPVMSVSGGKVMTGGEEGGNDQGSGSGGGSSTTTAATAAATTAEAAATPSGTTPPAATGDAPSHPRSVFAALLVALATVLLLA